MVDFCHEKMSSLYWYWVALLLYRDKWISIFLLWWLSQWLVTYGAICWWHLITCGAISRAPQNEIRRKFKCKASV